MSMKKKKKRIRKPVMNWQTGDYKQAQTIRFDIPLQFLMLCRLVNITPKQLITDFMDNLSFGSWKREGRDRVKEILKEYFLEHGYGREFYSDEELRLIFKELDALGLLFPRDAEPEILESYASWRENYQAYWFNKWYAQ